MGLVTSIVDLSILKLVCELPSWLQRSAWVCLWSSRLHIIYWGCHRPDGSTRRTVSHVCWRHPVLWQLSSQRHRLASSSPVSLHVRHWPLLQIPSPAAQRQQDGCNLIWLQVEPHQAEYGQHVCSNRIRDNPTVSCRAWSELSLRQWVVNETSCRQGGPGQIILCDPMNKWRSVVLRWISLRTIRSFTFLLRDAYA